MKGRRIRRHRVRQKRSIPASHRHFVPGESDKRRMLSEFAGVAFHYRHRQQTPVDVDDPGKEKDGEFGFLKTI